MSEGFADFAADAAAALRRAQEAAGADLVGHIGTEHLLAALLRDPGSPAGQALARLGITLAAVEENLREQATRTQRIILSAVPASSRAETVFSRARALAAARHDSLVGSQDLLLALAEDPESVAGRVLSELGATPEAVGGALSGR
jgi:ATP-dependent Clp protease ATP-binding subunit ClpA